MSEETQRKTVVLTISRRNLSMHDASELATMWRRRIQEVSPESVEVVVQVTNDDGSEFSVSGI